MPRPQWFYGRHPPACTCVECNKRRLDRRASMAQSGESPREAREGIQPAFRSRRRLRRAGRAIWRVALGLLGLAIVGLVVLTGGLVGFHWYQGAPFDTSLKMMTDDYRVAVVCPGEYEVVLDFVNRSVLDTIEVTLAVVLGHDWVREVCDGAEAAPKAMPLPPPPTLTPPTPARTSSAPAAGTSIPTPPPNDRPVAAEELAIAANPTPLARVAATSSASPARGATVSLTTSVDTVYYQVRGETTEEIFDSIEANGPDYETVIEGMFTAGLTHAESSYQSEFFDRGTSCGLRSVDIDLRLTVTLPQHSGLSALGDPQLSRWIDHTEMIAAHEQRHVDIHIESIEGFRRTLEDFPTEFSDCDSLRSSLASAWSLEETLDNQAQDDFHQSEDQLSRTLRRPVQAQIDQNEAELDKLQSTLDQLSSETEELKAQIAAVDESMRPYDITMTAIQAQYPDLVLPTDAFREYERLAGDWNALNDQRNGLITLVSVLVDQHNRTVREFNRLTEQTGQLIEELAWLP